MKSADVVWYEETLDAYLADPQGYIPGNINGLPGLGR
jgi:cytochrome c2